VVENVVGEEEVLQLLKTLKRIEEASRAVVEAMGH